MLGKGGLQTPEPVMDVDSMETGQPLLALVFFQLAAQSSSTHPLSAWKFQKGPLQGNVKLDLLVPVLSMDGCRGFVYRSRCDIIPLFLNLLHHHRFAINHYFIPSSPCLIGNRINFPNNLSCVCDTFFGAIVHPSFIASQEKKQRWSSIDMLLRL